MASKQDNYLRMHHPSIYKGMKNGGKVKKKNYYAEGGKNTDTVPAMLTPGEVVLNAEQQESLGKLVGMKPAALFEKIGIPGFAGGGKATKEDALMQHYQEGGVSPYHDPGLKKMREGESPARYRDKVYMQNLINAGYDKNRERADSVYSSYSDDQLSGFLNTANQMGGGEQWVGDPSSRTRPSQRFYTAPAYRAVADEMSWRRQDGGKTPAESTEETKKTGLLGSLFKAGGGKVKKKKKKRGY